jgi:hypothetical protein
MKRKSPFQPSASRTAVIVELDPGNELPGYSRIVRLADTDCDLFA